MNRRESIYKPSHDPKTTAGSRLDDDRQAAAWQPTMKKASFMRHNREKAARTHLR